MNSHIDTFGRISQKKVINVGNLILMIMVAVFVVTVIVINFHDFNNLYELQVLQTALDVFSMALCLVLFGACYYDNAGTEGVKLQFLRLTVLLYAALFLDFVCWFYGEDPAIRTFYFIMETLLGFMNPLFGIMCFEYILDYMDLRKKSFAKMYSLYIYSAGALAVFARIINIFFPIYFRIDENGYYFRTAYYPVSVVITVGILLFCLYIVFSNRKQLRTYQFWILTLFFIAVITGVILDVFILDLTLAFPTAAVLLLLIYSVLNLQRSRDHSIIE
ncbi:MAG: hypothetical protein K6F00_10515 [Lachnospiraceae bacterium]|nr:hypothetical protein [Lachnospiraceae bacterium]